VRVMREAFAAVVRRRDCSAAYGVGLLLGRVLLERGRSEAAERAFSDAAAAVDDISAADAARARVWLALARTDNGCQTDAESVLRAIKVAGALQTGLHRRWADASYGRTA
jgi:hypothetical protein